VRHDGPVTATSSGQIRAYRGHADAHDAEVRDAAPGSRGLAQFCGGFFREDPHRAPPFPVKVVAPNQIGMVVTTLAGHREAAGAQRPPTHHNGPMSDVPQSLEVDLATFAAAHAAGATLLDVRNPDEYEEKHVPGALLIPLGELSERQGEIPAGDPLYVICAAGGRSLAAAQALVGAGYPAVSVAGGTNGWEAAGHPVVRGSERG
jgi:rhodanese-related sulfurtransferase